MRRLFNKLVLVVLTMTAYILFTGMLTELTIVTGFITSIIAAILFDEFLIRKEVKSKDISKLVYMIRYIIQFVVAEAKEHINMTKIILKGDSRVNPAVVKVPLDLDTDYGIALVALTITNMPGTIALHIDKPRKMLYVHWLTARAGDITEIKKEIIGEFEHIAKKIFG